MYYSLFISITGFLIVAEWKDRTSALDAKAEVTVQPESVVPSEGPPPLIYTKGSFFATVETGSSLIGETVEYTVVCNDGSCIKVPRRQLRHRVWHRIAFLGVTNEKQHVGLTTQAFHTEELEFWRCWHEFGRDAALAYAAADRAAVPSLVPPADQDSAKARFDATRATRRAAAAAAAAINTRAPAAPAGTVESDPAIPPCAAAVTARSLAATKPRLATDMARLDEERFGAQISHSDNATHLKSSENLYYWSEKRGDEVTTQGDDLTLEKFMSNILVEYGCPHKGKGPWDGIGAAVKTRIRNAIINEIARKSRTTPSGVITNAIEVVQHLRSVMSTPKWLSDHASKTIHEYVPLYIDQDEIVWPAGEAPEFSTFKNISSRYSFLMRPGRGRVGGARYSCWCPAHCLAFDTGEGMDNLLDIAGCKRRHLNEYEYGRGSRHGYEEATITCTQAAGQRNAKARQQELWKELKQLLLKTGADRFAAVQARVLWAEEELVHMRPGHFWACQLGDAGLLLGDASRRGSPILAGPFDRRQQWPPLEGEAGWKVAFRGIKALRYDAGECAILLRCYYHRTADDPEGLTFLRHAKVGTEILVINSCERRAVQGRQKNDFKLAPPQPPPEKRQQAARAKKNAKHQVEPPYDPKMRWRLARNLDVSTRIDCMDT